MKAHLAYYNLSLHHCVEAQHYSASKFNGGMEETLVEDELVHILKERKQVVQPICLNDIHAYIHKHILATQVTLSSFPLVKQNIKLEWPHVGHFTESLLAKTATFASWQTSRLKGGTTMKAMLVCV